MLDPGKHGFAADVSQETLTLTTLGTLDEGATVNLELALAAGERLGGHLVTGHVDGMARLVSRHGDARAERARRPRPQRSRLWTGDCWFSTRSPGRGRRP